MKPIKPPVFVESVAAVLGKERSQRNLRNLREMGYRITKPKLPSKSKKVV